MIIGLAGTYCSGKNHIAAILEKRGIPVLDADKLGHLVMQTDKKAIKAIADRFGSEILNSDGTINRKTLGIMVFGKPAEMADLEAIIHPAVNAETEKWITAQNGKACVINAALLHKSCVFQKLDAIILVTAPLFTRMLRARKRDKLPWIDIWKRFQSQKDFRSQYFTGKADIYRVENPQVGSAGPQVGMGPQTSPVFSGSVPDRLEKRIDEILSLIAARHAQGQN